MSHGASPLAAFHLIGDRSRLEPESARKTGLRPALYAGFGDLSKLRYHFPLVLLNDTHDRRRVRPLTDLFDEVLRELAPPGSEGDEMRRQLLALEQLIRTRVAEGQEGNLVQLWEQARRTLVEREGADTEAPAAESLNANLTRARAALTCDGKVIDCDARMAKRLLLHAWRESERLKSLRLGRRIARLQQKLEDILKVDDLNSPEASNASRLEQTVGSADRTVFDFEEMSRLLRRRGVAQRLPDTRKGRITAAIEIMRAQRFVAWPEGQAGKHTDIHRFRFADCQQALASFRERLPEMAALVKAISIAELEVENHYVETRHDDFFAGFDENRLGPADLAQFPAYLVCLERLHDEEQAVVIDVLRAGLPFKILAQSTDILGDASISGGQLSFGTQGQQLARMAVGLDNVFVLQAAASSLYRMRDSLMAGLASSHSALFSVYAGNGYLDAAAATESRTFPSFAYDPSAGDGQAARFTLEGNPQPLAGWPVHRVCYEDDNHAAGSEELEFTLADFIAPEPRFADRFACISQSEWNEELVPLGRFLELSARERADKVPYVLLIDEDNVLRRAVVDETLVDAADRCLGAWRSLQEMGGIDNSHVAAALTEARAAWDEEKAQLQAHASAQTAAPAPAEPAPSPGGAEAQPEAPPEVQPEEAVSEPSSDDPWIETIRCTTCNECTEINDRMFAYNEDKRAFIKDPDAGTYRQLVEAAETCQVAIIHPGKPRNLDEPGLDELLKRAEPFL